MGFLHIILPIIVGGVIGYFTNYIAIKMVFHPRKAVYVGKHKLPFTPGIIPKNRKRIAYAAGDAVSEQLLTKEVVLERLEETCDKMISELAAYLYVGNTSVIEMLPENVSDDALVDSASAAIARGIIKKIDQADIDSVIRDFGEETIGSITADKPMLTMLLSADAKNAIYDKMGKAVRNYINERGEEKLKAFINDYIRDLSNKPLKDIVQSEDGQARLKDIAKGAIERAVNKYGAAILSYIDIKGIVAERIETMDPEELEKLVLSVMKQELQAVINLGAVIGAIIGIINIFI